MFYDTENFLNHIWLEGFVIDANHKADNAVSLGSASPKRSGGNYTFMNLEIANARANDLLVINGLGATYSHVHVSQSSGYGINLVSGNNHRFYSLIANDSRVADTRVADCSSVYFDHSYWYNESNIDTKYLVQIVDAIDVRFNDSMFEPINSASKISSNVLITATGSIGGIAGFTNEISFDNCSWQGNGMPGTLLTVGNETEAPVARVLLRDSVMIQPAKGFSEIAINRLAKFDMFNVVSKTTYGSLPYSEPTIDSRDRSTQFTIGAADGSFIFNIKNGRSGLLRDKSDEDRVSLYSGGHPGFTETWDESRKLMLFELKDLPVFSDNAAAIRGGLKVGNIYRDESGHLLVVN
jgi:hypothetical protein